MFDWLQKHHEELATDSQNAPERNKTAPEDSPEDSPGAASPSVRPIAYQTHNAGSGGDHTDQSSDQMAQTIEEILEAQRRARQDDPDKTLLTPAKLLQKASSRLDSTKVGDPSVSAGQLAGQISAGRQQASQPQMSPLRTAPPQQAPAPPAQPPDGAQQATPGMPPVAPSFSLPARQGLSIPPPQRGSIPFLNESEHPHRKNSRFARRSDSPSASLEGMSVPLRDPGENGVESRIRQFVLSILSQPQLSASLPEGLTQALRLLLSPHPTQTEIEEGMAALQAFDVMVQVAQADALVEEMPRPLKLWYHTPSWYASRMWLMQHHREFPRNSIEIFAQASHQARTHGFEMAAHLLRRHEQLLVEATQTGIDSAYRSIIGDEAFTPPSPTQSGESLDEDAIGHYFDLLLAWLETPDWGTSRQFLHAHPELLSDVAEAVLEQMYQLGTKDRPVIEDHQVLLRAARLKGIDQAYMDRGKMQARGSGERRLTSAQQRLLTTLVEWIQTPDWNSSRSFLRAHTELLSHETETLLAALYAGQETDGARQVIVDHIWLIRAALQAGIDVAYDGLLAMLHERQLNGGHGGPMQL